MIIERLLKHKTTKGLGPWGIQLPQQRSEQRLEKRSEGSKGRQSKRKGGCLKTGQGEEEGRGHKA